MFSGGGVVSTVGGGVVLTVGGRHFFYVKQQKKRGKHKKMLTCFNKKPPWVIATDGGKFNNVNNKMINYRKFVFLTEICFPLFALKYCTRWSVEQNFARCAIWLAVNSWPQSKHFFTSVFLSVKDSDEDSAGTEAVSAPLISVKVDFTSTFLGVSRETFTVESGWFSIVSRGSPLGRYRHSCGRSR